MIKKQLICSFGICAPVTLILTFWLPQILAVLIGVVLGVSVYLIWRRND